MNVKIPFRAHARLLTMLGEQLIKNERIALVELVKNAYDADATKVSVDFRGFGDSWANNGAASVVITDNGVGMSDSTLNTVWMSPATPAKAIAKRTNPVTARGRALQGEKGIGRFATFKLGSLVEVRTRAEGAIDESLLLLDITLLNEDGGTEEESDSLFLEDLYATTGTESPRVFSGSPPVSSRTGTQISLSGLRAVWTPRLVESAFDDLERIRPLMWRSDRGAAPLVDFEVKFTRDGEDLHLRRERDDDFQVLLERSVLAVTQGQFDSETRSLRFSLNNRPVELSLDSSEIRGLRVFKDSFLSEDRDIRPEFTCGEFGFEFYVFDFNQSAPARHLLDRQEKKILEQHRIYLYRDGVRVYPYGDPGDDWLQIDTIRGTQSARSMFSNDQTVGYVTITQSANPALRDKTNREGLLETGNATHDFVALIQTVLAYLRAKPYEEYAIASRRARQKRQAAGHVDERFDALKKTRGLPISAAEQINNLQRVVSEERAVSKMQIARTEQLAGVGLSVETASHDLITAGREALRMAKRVVAELKLLDLTPEPVYTMATNLVTRLEFVASRLEDVQGLFVSTRQKPGDIDVLQLARRVRSMYEALHHEVDISSEVDESVSLRVKSTEGAVLQCLINLVDNATYWLMSAPHQPKVIRIFATSPTQYVVTDSGPGIREQDLPYIFEPFYSGKGEDGKGLGLYIARQNGQRSGFLVEANKVDDPRVLPGATFVVTFEEGR